MFLFRLRKLVTLRRVVGNLFPSAYVSHFSWSNKFVKWVYSLVWWKNSVFSWILTLQVSRRLKMIVKAFTMALVLIACGRCDWVKLPQITNTPSFNKIKTSSSMGSSSVWGNSDVLSSVFSYDVQPQFYASTTESSLVTASQSEKLINTKKYLISTVTSKTLDFVDEISDRTDYGEMETHHVKLASAGNLKQSRKVAYVNQTVPMRVVPLFVEGTKKPQIIQQEDEEDDGVTVLEEGEGLSSSEEAASDEEFYEYEELPTSTSTTKPLRKQKLTTQKPRRRVSQMSNTKPKLRSPLSFSHFLKFVKNIQETFSTRTAKNINDKIKMLRDFRDNLLLSINQRIKNLWKTKTKKQPRVKRTLGWMEPTGGAMDFPSAEGALLSISFLTFAVFLIKLVLVSWMIIVHLSILVLFPQSFSKWLRRLKWRNMLTTTTTTTAKDIKLLILWSSDIFETFIPTIFLLNMYGLRTLTISNRSSTQRFPNCFNCEKFWNKVIESQEMCVS